MSYWPDKRYDARRCFKSLVLVEKCAAVEGASTEAMATLNFLNQFVQRVVGMAGFGGERSFLIGQLQWAFELRLAMPPKGVLVPTPCFDKIYRDRSIRFTRAAGTIGSRVPWRIAIAKIVRQDLVEH
ncbi:MAG: hypothetical protein WC816_04590 [Sphingomonas sp.]